MKSSVINHFICYLFVLCLQDCIKKMINIIKIEKFIEKNGFNLWRINMRALLKEHGIWAPLSSQWSKIQEEKVHALILLSLFDKVLYEVSQELTIVGLWLKLEKLFMTKLICNKLLVKRYLFGL